MRTEQLLCLCAGASTILMSEFVYEMAWYVPSMRCISMPLVHACIFLATCTIVPGITMRGDVLVLPPLQMRTLVLGTAAGILFVLAVALKFTRLEECAYTAMLRRPLF